MNKKEITQLTVLSENYIKSIKKVKEDKSTKKLPKEIQEWMSALVLSSEALLQKWLEITKMFEEQLSKSQDCQNTLAYTEGQLDTSRKQLKEFQEKLNLCEKEKSKGISGKLRGFGL